MNHIARLLVPLLLAASAGALAAEKATLARDTEMRAKALSDAVVVMPLKSGAAVTLVTRSGAWAQVTTAEGKTGWVRLLNLRTSGTQKGDSGAASLASLFKTGSSGRSVATGVKGMSDEELTGATPSPEQVERLSKLRVTPDDARASATRAGLKAKDVAYLAAPAADGEE